MDETSPKGIKLDDNGTTSQNSYSDLSTPITIRNSQKQHCKKGTSRVLTVGRECGNASLGASVDDCLPEFTIFGDTGSNVNGLGREIDGLTSSFESRPTHNDAWKALNSTERGNDLITGQSNIVKIKKSNFVPVNVVVSVIPQLYNERFPKLDKRHSEKFVCKWCPQTMSRSKINKFAYLDIVFLVKHYVKKHKDIPIKDYGVQCEDCGAYFYHKKTLERHLVDGICCQSLRQKYNFKKLSQDIEMRVCEYCDIVFISQKRYKKHLHSNDNGNCIFEGIKHPMELGCFDYMKCKYCGEMFLYENDFRNHTKPWQYMSKLKYDDGSSFKCKGVSLRVYSCQICLQNYSKYQTFWSHINFDHDIEEFNLKCDRCGKFFRFRVEFEEHRAKNERYPFCIDFDSCRTIPRRIESHDYDASFQLVKQSSTKYKCPVCEKNFSLRYFLVNHLKEHHPDYDSSSLKCPDCGMSFICLLEYENHMNKWKCPFCEEETIFSMKRVFKDHLKRKHKIEKIIPQQSNNVACNICNIVFKEEFLLQYHMKTIHESGLKICPFCGEDDVNRINMYAHVRKRHAYQAPNDQETEIFTCDLCKDKKTFTEKFRLDRHIACVHKKAETTECDICHKTYAQKATMMRHRRIHLDIKPFKCGICDLSFTQKTGMRAHRARHYNKDGTLKSAEEIKQQVEVIKLQREKPCIPKTPGKRSRRSRNMKICEGCGDEFSSAAKLSSHICKQSDNEIHSDVNDEINTDDSGQGTTGQNREAPQDSKKDDNENSLKYDYKCANCEKDFVSSVRLETHRCRKRRA